MEHQDILHPFLQECGFVILDGALSTELEARGNDISSDLWSAKLLIDRPEDIEAVHYEYYVAGADICTTSSYQATFEGFSKLGLSDSDTEGLLRLSVDLCRSARERFWREYSTSRESNKPEASTVRLFPLVAASIGPYGAMLGNGEEYSGKYGSTMSIQELVQFHRRRAEVLIQAGPDLLLFETIPTLQEGKAICELIHELQKEKRLKIPPVMISFSCCDHEHTSNHEDFLECARVVDHYRTNLGVPVLAVGVNCTKPAFVGNLIRVAKDTLSSHGACPPYIIAYPNSGEEWDGLRRCWVQGSGIFASAPQSPTAEEGPREEPFVSVARAMFQTGAHIIGGCCRTKPEHIQQARATLTKVVASTPKKH